jgi:two-component system, NtrC family, sensor histidine kinase PilS
VAQEFSRQEYFVRIKWLIWSRVVLATLLIGSLVFFQGHYKIYPFQTVYFYYFLFTVYGLTALYAYLLKKIKNLSFLAYLQTSGDIALVSILTHITGGIDSGFSLLYHLTIISSSMILYRKGAYLAASFSSILYGAMLDMQFYNVAGFIRSQNFTAMQVLYHVYISILSFYIVAFLSGTLAERLRTARQELHEKSVDFEDLRVLQEHILRSVGSGIFTMDLQGNIASWNPAAEQITGYPFGEIKDRWKEIFGDTIKGIFGHTEALRERPFRFDGQIVKKNGTTAILGMTASLLKDEKNAVQGIILTFQDITKIIEMEDQVRRQERLATVGSLAAGIAHEIRNPLASLYGSIQVLQGELALQGDNKHLMDIVVKETDRLNTIITDFLEYARPKATLVDKIDLLTILDETVMLLKNNKEFTEDIRISCYIDQHVIVKGDTPRLRQVFWNLLINACQAIQDGGEIDISARTLAGSDEATPFCELVIMDTGQGIARDCLDKIFDPFFTTKTGGTGLGLAIVYRIIEDHGGTISVDSEPGKGTRFAIRLPLAEGPCYFSDAGTMLQSKTNP